jgi:hypothetical protein
MSTAYMPETLYVTQDAVDAVSSDGGGLLAIQLLGEMQHQYRVGGTLSEEKAEIELEATKRHLRRIGEISPAMEAYSHTAHSQD